MSPQTPALAADEVHVWAVPLDSPGFDWRQAALGLFLFIIPATLLFHAFWSADAASYQNQLNHFLKNLAIMGGMLYVVVFGPGALSLDEPADRS